MKLSKQGASPFFTRAGLTRGGVFIVALIVMPQLFPQHWIWNMMFFTVLYAAMSVSWNLVGGFAGYPSLGHAAFFGIGAYAMASLFKSTHILTNGWQPFFVMPLIGLGCAVIAIPIGYIAMRVRADVFAIVTITLLFVAQTLGYNLKGLTGGAQGAGLSVAPFRLDIFEQPFYFAAAFLLLLAMGIAYFVTKTKLGMALTSIRADEDKARGVGVRTTGVKVMAFAVSVGITGMAGGIWAYYLGFIYPQFAFDPLITIAIVLMTFLGGRATVWGPVLGAAILMPAQQLLAYYVGGSQIYLIAYAAIFLLIMLLLPRGILPTFLNKRRMASMATKGDLSGVSTSPVATGGINS